MYFIVTIQKKLFQLIFVLGYERRESFTHFLFEMRYVYKQRTRLGLNKLKDNIRNMILVSPKSDYVNHFLQESGPTK